MWTYQISTGKMSRNGATFTGYSGAPEYKNKADAVSIVASGPIPPGDWSMTDMRLSKNTGPYSIVLEPSPATNVYGRSAFRIHGDSAEHPGQASHGCIIMPRDARLSIWKSGDRFLRVIP